MYAESPECFQGVTWALHPITWERSRQSGRVWLGGSSRVGKICTKHSQNAGAGPRTTAPRITHLQGVYYQGLGTWHLSLLRGQRRDTDLWDEMWSIS